MYSLGDTFFNYAASRYFFPFIVINADALLIFSHFLFQWLKKGKGWLRRKSNLFFEGKRVRHKSF